jgi:hypothetical protein
MIHFVKKGEGSAICGQDRTRFNKTSEALGDAVEPAGHPKCGMCKKIIKGIELKNKGKLVAIFHLAESEWLTGAEVEQVMRALPAHIQDDFLADWYDEDAANVIESLKDAIKEGKNKKWPR